MAALSATSASAAVPEGAGEEEDADADHFAQKQKQTREKKESAAAEIKERIAKLKAGVEMLKMPRTGAPSLKKVVLSEDELSISWPSAKLFHNSETLHLKDVYRLVLGTGTAVFAKHVSEMTPAMSARSFSLLYTDDRSFDVVAPSSDLWVSWTSTFDYLLRRAESLAADAAELTGKPRPMLVFSVLDVRAGAT